MNRHARGRGHTKGRRQTPPVPTKTKIIGAVVGLALAWPTVQISLALSHASDKNDLAAADYAVTSQAAATVAAQQRLADGDAGGAQQLARRALAVSPISAPALRVLGLAEQQQNSMDQAGALMSQAAALGWRDTPSQLWLAAAFLQSKDYSGAANRLDAALRVNPDEPQIYALLDASAKDPEIAKAMVDRLILNPDWRTPYFTDSTVGTPDVAHVRAVLLNALFRTVSPPTQLEILPVVRRLAAAGLDNEGRALWFKAMGQAVSNLYDPDFVDLQTHRTVPYQWRIASLLGTDAKSDPGQNGARSSLHVTSDGMTSGTAVDQSLQLPQGAHRFSIITTGSAAAMRAFSWTIRCSGRRPLLMTLPSSIGNSAAPFTVPADCNQQTIELHTQSGLGNQQHEAWFNGAAIS